MEEKPVLAMYDIRGIQEYIFKTNQIKDIMGASKIVGDILEQAFKEASKSCGYQKIWKWEKQKGLEVLEKEEIKAQVLFIGGGNGYIVYKDRSYCEEINKKMSLLFLKHTYSLQLAIAVVEKTENFWEDYEKVNEEMEEVKRRMPPARWMGAFPVVQTDQSSGYPLTMEEKETGKYFCTETYLKQETAKKIPQGEEKLLDNLIRKKELDSNIAIVHIDGNHMGERIQELMGQEEGAYTDAVNRMRGISERISGSFRKTMKYTKEKLDEWLSSEENETLDPGRTYLREIIQGGDDITFVCNASIALSLTEIFIRKISEYGMDQDAKAKGENRYRLSVCAGIAYLHSHFPFSTGYQVAEECCRMAKKRANEQKIGKETKEYRYGNWVDFQICKDIQATDLSAYRKKQYTTKDGARLLRRPYYLKGSARDSDMDKQNEQFDFEKFKDIYKHFFQTEQFPLSMAMEIKNTYSYGENEMNSLMTFAKSRYKKMPSEYKKPFMETGDGLKCASWYDALEMYRFYTMIQKEEEKHEDSN